MFFHCRPKWNASYTTDTKILLNLVPRVLSHASWQWTPHQGHPSRANVLSEYELNLEAVLCIQAHAIRCGKLNKERGLFMILLKQCSVRIVPVWFSVCLVSCKQEGTHLTTNTEFILKSRNLMTSNTNISIHCAFKKCFYRIHHTDEILSSSLSSYR